MKRDIEKELLVWKEQSSRMPLLLRGARQVGKTFVIEKFGHSEFEELISINFESHPEYKRCFETVNPKDIVSTIEVMINKRVVPGKTLLFLDEIQECPQAILSLRYFKEKLPELHVIGAGSLLEFTLKEGDFRFPVGRVEFMYLGPLSFREFLLAIGEDLLLENIETFTPTRSIASAIHEKGLALVKLYSVLGGMPDVIREYRKTGSLQRCSEIQMSLLAGYRHDFGKYAKKTDHSYLERVLETSPSFLGQWYKYAKVDDGASPRKIKEALHKLVDAGLIHLVRASSASGIPLIATMNERKFKLLFLDIGLAKRMMGIEIDILLAGRFPLINEGALAEQFVGQQLVAIHSCREKSQLFSWVREAKSSSAEVDYLVQDGGRIIPIEVKAGATGRLRSLQLFMNEKKSRIGVHISTQPYAKSGQILAIPFYLISELGRLLRS